MRKIIVMISTVAVFALATFTANACSFDEHSASLKQDQVASALPDTAKVTTSEAMSTFDPKHQPLFEAAADKSEESIVSKEITE